MTRHDGLDILATGDAGFRKVTFSSRQLGVHLYIGNLDAIANEVITLHLFILDFVSRVTDVGAMLSKISSMEPS